MSKHTPLEVTAKTAKAKFLRAMSKDSMVRAADDMLAALRAVVAGHEIREVGRLKGDRIVIPFAALDGCRAAIAKAEGRLLP